MAAPLPLRSDSDADAPRALAKGSRDPAQAQRRTAPSAIHAGGSRREAAALGGVELQPVRDRVVAFNGQGLDGLIDRKAPGCRPRLNVERREALLALVERGPMPAAHGVARRRLVYLAQIMLARVPFEDHGAWVLEQTSGRIMGGMGYRKISARPPPITLWTRTPSPLWKTFPGRLTEIAPFPAGS